MKRIKIINFFVIIMIVIMQASTVFAVGVATEYDGGGRTSNEISGNDDGAISTEIRDGASNKNKEGNGSGEFNYNEWAPGSTEIVTGADYLMNIANIIIGWINIIVSILSVIILSITGIKYMVGSVEEKASYKEQMKPYIIGCIMGFGTVKILKIIMIVARMFN